MQRERNDLGVELIEADGIQDIGVFDFNTRGFLGASSDAFRDAAYVLQLADQKRVLDNFNTHFDVWTSEKSLHTSGAVNRGFEKLKSQGHMFVEEGATWLRTSDIDDDIDRVLIKADGALTYFASDTAYYVDKRNRGYDLCIYLLGADHHGYVNRLRAVAACAGDNPDDNIQILISSYFRGFSSHCPTPTIHSLRKFLGIVLSMTSLHMGR